MTGFFRAAHTRQTKTRFLDACAARAAAAEDPKHLEQFAPERLATAPVAGRRPVSVTDLPDAEIEEYLNHLGFTLETS
jgi:hypothetical protein